MSTPKKKSGNRFEGASPPTCRASRSADLVRAVVSKDNVNAAEQLTCDGAHGGPPWLARIEATLQIFGQIRIPLAGGDRRQPERTSQMRRAALGHVCLSRRELARRKDARIDAAVCHQTF